ncbi:unnamed protein product [Callosobruchus maculatus]|uniref:Uncharacterized protein n=1 Tax=Callosobruchus maculatus TaxID=64391 RepID=A0A653BLG7_CALMS|nr:unnamed protein product [Callosobruchus maculatus]
MLSFHCTMANWKKTTHEERLAKERQAERLRQQRIKNYLAKYEQKYKEKKNYGKKKDKGNILTVD